MISLLNCRVTLQFPNVKSEVENLGETLECKDYLQEGKEMGVCPLGGKKNLIINQCIV